MYKYFSFKRLALACVVSGLCAGGSLYAQAPGDSPLPPAGNPAPDSSEPALDALPPPPGTPAASPESISPPPREAERLRDSQPEEQRTREIHQEPTRQSLTRDMPQPNEPEKPSSEVGQKIFDWSKYKNATEVPHPFAEKGLIRIDKDRTYYYRVEETPTNRAISLHFGTYQPTNLSNPEQSGQRGATFKENYDQTSNPAVMLMFEWKWWRTAVGNVNIQAGTGAFVAQGHGHFVGPDNAALTPREVFTFFAAPNSLGLVYRAQIAHRQFIVPYGGGGLTALTFGEFRDDNKGPKFGGSLAAYADVGLGINMTYFDYLARINLNREYGISAVYLTLEYRQLLALTQRYDFTAPYANAGFLVEY